MEDKKLNFDQPLLSVRRSYAPTITSQKTSVRNTSNSHHVIPQLPYHKPELKSGPITNPGSVPFLWEQIPGEPKQEIKLQTQTIAAVPIGPKLPPGRYQKAGNNQGYAANVSSASNDVCCSENIDKSREMTDEKSSGSVDSDEAYVDALDSLSRTESNFLNCSMSGRGELDVKPSGNFSTENREFMMDRFLLAAKAMTMASGMPHYTAPKKQTIVEEKSQPEQRIISQYKPSLRYGPSFAAQYSGYQCDDEDEEDSDDGERRNLPVACGLLSQLCLLNPVPSMSTRNRAPVSSDEKSMSDKTAVKSIDKIQTDEGKAEMRNGRGELESHSTSTYSDAVSIILDEKDRIKHGKSKTFQELLAEKDSEEESDSGGSVVEKTLYVDTMQKVVSAGSRSSSPNAQNTFAAKDTLDSREEEQEIINKRMDQVNMCIRDLKKLDDVDGKEENNESKGVEKQVPRAKAIKQSHQVPAAPPLPKSPSDSWLVRALPSKRTKNPTLRSYLAATTHCENALTSDAKWETLVKTTKVQNRELHHSEGFLTSIPET